MTGKGVSTPHTVNFDELPLSPKGQELFSYLPHYYENSRIMRADAEAKGREMDLLHQALEETLDQFFVRTATWGLDIWERELDIAVDPAKPVEQRRSVVESKLRGGGVFSGKMVRNVAAAYERGTVDVTFQPDEWAFTIHFVDTIGLPPNLDDLKAAIEDIKPAHMTVEYEFSYLLIRDVDGVMTLGQLDRTALDKFAFN
ncbi:YmfQ family protein [Saccharibacillus sacchari]|uniref:YmfQ family protein n=1 Tax=Saccharibacillus sacchari TaxID=456493 RepID=A0ACC6PI94_9BACL